MATRMLQRRGTSAEWAADDPVLADGEIGYDRTTKHIKMGDGVTPWSQLDGAHLNKSGGTMTGPLTVLTPTNPQHAARKDYVDSADQAEASARASAVSALQGADSAINTDLQTHKTATNPHSATSAATAERLALRDANGRARFANPDHAQDAANKGWVESQAVLKSLATAKGDILAASAANVLARLAAGNPGEALIADPGAPLGVRWGSVGGGGGSLGLPVSTDGAPNVTVANNTTYTVPAGKMLVVLAVWNTDVGSVISARGRQFFSGIANHNFNSSGGMALEVPLLVFAGQTVVTAQFAGRVHGVLVDASPTLSTMTFWAQWDGSGNNQVGGPYTVPSGKRAVITHCLSSDPGATFQINGHGFWGGIANRGSNLSSGGHNNLPQPVVATAGNTIACSGPGAAIFGYLEDV